MKYYSVTVPTKPHLYKYITTREGSPLFMNSDSPFCIMLRCCLGKNVHTDRSKKEIAGRMQFFTSDIQIMIPTSKMSLFGFSINEHHIIMLNRFLENDFEDELVRHSRYFIKEDVRYAGFKEAYESFAEKFNISLEEDIPYDTLKKIEYRARKRLENIFPQNVPSLIQPEKSLFI